MELVVTPWLDGSLPSGKRSAGEGIVAWWAIEELNL